jgi:arsenate reductase
MVGREAVRTSACRLDSLYGHHSNGVVILLVPMKVLFVCVGNSCRSQMAEGFAREYGHDAASAGTTPASRVASNAVEVMAELGIDISAQTPKLLDLESLDSWDKVISMGCGVEETCPTLKADADWGLDDPVSQGLDVYRNIRDQIMELVQILETTMFHTHD